jgi:DNA-binding NtrC family response regulator
VKHFKVHLCLLPSASRLRVAIIDILDTAAVFSFYFPMYELPSKGAPLNPWQGLGAELSGWSEALPAKLGIVEDDSVTSLLLSELARNFGFQPEVMANGGEARQRFGQAGKAAPWDLVVIDLGLPDCDGLNLLQEIKLHHPEMPCMVLTARDKAMDAVKALRSGAAEYAVKPINPQEFFSQARMVLEKARWAAALTNDWAAIGSDFGFPWKSKAMIGVKELFRHALTTTVPVLIEGEAGLGKYSLARGIHHRSHGGEGELVEFTGGEVDDEAFNLALYGGEFMAPGLQGIRTRRRGLFSQSRPSTLLLRGVENLLLASQERLCRALEAGSGRCRVIAITDKPLEELVSLDGVSSDLFYQLATLRIPLPALRLRQEDLFALTEQTLSETCVRQGRRRPRLGRAACRWIKEYEWPGNISELRLVIEVALELTSGAEIGEAALASGVEKWRADFQARKAQVAGRKLDDLERAALVNALKASGGNRRRVATKLGVSLRTVYNMLDRYGLKGRF